MCSRCRGHFYYRVYQTLKTKKAKEGNKCLMLLGLLLSTGRTQCFFRFAHQLAANSVQVWYLRGQSWECAGFQSKHCSSCFPWLVPLLLKVLISEIILGGRKKNLHKKKKKNSWKTRRYKHTPALTCRSCIWCWSPAGTSPQPPWTPGTGGRVLYRTAASPGSRGRRRLARRRPRRLHRQPWRSRSSSSRAKCREPPPPIAETAAYDWSSGSSCFTQRHLILSGLGGGQTGSGWRVHTFCRDEKVVRRAAFTVKSALLYWEDTHLILQRGAHGALSTISELFRMKAFQFTGHGRVH